jgi:hypothetical protein
MAEFAVDGPLGEGHLHDNFRADPMRVAAGEPDSFRERRLRDFEPIQSSAQLCQKLRVKPGADLAGEHEVLFLEVPHQQSAESGAAALWVREAPNHEFLRGLAFHLEPVWGATVLIRCVAALCDNAFPAFFACAFPRPFAREFRDAVQRRPQGQSREQVPPLVQREPGYVTPFMPEDVKHVVRGRAALAPHSGGLAVQDDLVDRQFPDCCNHGGVRRVLQQLIARQQPHFLTVLEREQADAVQLALERPLGTAESLLRERRRHRLYPVWKCAGHSSRTLLRRVLRSCLQLVAGIADDALVDGAVVTQEEQDQLVGRALREYTEALKRGQLLAAEVHKVGEHLRALGQQIMQHANAQTLASTHASFTQYLDAGPLLKLIDERDEQQHKVTESVRTLTELGLAPVSPTK